MSEFKGTKGKWNYEIVRNSTCKICVVDNSFAEVYLPYNADDIKEMEANALLISKAPEMLEMLERVVALEDIICMGGAVGEQWVGEAQALEEMMDKIKQLIKSATEL